METVSLINVQFEALVSGAITYMSGRRRFRARELDWQTYTKKTAADFFIVVWFFSLTFLTFTNFLFVRIIWTCAKRTKISDFIQYSRKLYYPTSVSGSGCSVAVQKRFPQRWKTAKCAKKKSLVFFLGSFFLGTQREFWNSFSHFSKNASRLPRHMDSVQSS